MTDVERLQVARLIALADTSDALQRKLALGSLLVLLAESEIAPAEPRRPALRLVREEP
jgi:hypothetical protein